MPVLEIISLRGATSLSEYFCEGLLMQVLEHDKLWLQPSIKAYRLNNIESDLSFHLHWSSREDKVEKSQIGIAIAQHLKDFGLVSHTVWLEIAPHRGLCI